MPLKPTESDNGRPAGGWLARLFRRESRPPVGTFSYRRLAVRLDVEMREGKDVGRLMVATVDEPEVAVEAALHLALSLGEELGHRVLLVDASSDSGITLAAGATEARGLGDLVSNGVVQPETSFFETACENVVLLPSGRSLDVPRPQKLLETLARAESGFDFVIVCVGSVLAEAPTLALCPAMDRILLLAVEGRTYMDSLGAGRGILDRWKAPDVALVLTGRPGRPDPGRA